MNSTHHYMKSFSILAALAIGVSFQAIRAADIPDRPEKLHFPPLKYDPPVPANYRVALKSGPVAYLVPDRELPLVNMHILVHTGDFAEAPGKEGLAEMTGHLLVRGGIKSKSAEELEE